jgi:hypothetical protein
MEARQNAAARRVVFRELGIARAQEYIAVIRAPREISASGGFFDPGMPGRVSFRNASAVKGAGTRGR